MTTHYGKGIAQRTCARRRPYRSRDAAHSLPTVDPSRSDVLRRVLRDRPHNGERRVPRPWSPSTWPTEGQLHRFRAHMVLLATGGYGRENVFLLHLKRARAPATAAGMVLRAPTCRFRDMEFVPVPPHRRLRLRAVSSPKARAARAATSDQLQGRAVHGAVCAEREGSCVARCGQPCDDDRDSARGVASVRELTIHIESAPGTPRPRGHSRASARNRRDGAHLRGRRCDQTAHSSAAHRALQHGGHTL